MLVGSWDISYLSYSGFGHESVIGGLDKIRPRPGNKLELEKMVNLYDQLTTCCKCLSHSHFFYPIFFFLSFLLTNTSTDSLFMRSRPEVFSVINFKWYKVKILYIILLFIFE